MFFPQNFSSMKVSKNKVLGTAQKLTGTKENIWVDVDIGEPEPWSGLIIKAGVQACCILKAFLSDEIGLEIAVTQCNSEIFRDFSFPCCV